MQIFIKNSVGKDITLEVEPHHTIAQVKKMINNKEGIPFDQQMLIFGGKALEDDKILDECAVFSWTVIHLKVLQKVEEKPGINIHNIVHQNNSSAEGCANEVCEDEIDSKKRGLPVLTCLVVGVISGAGLGGFSCAVLLGATKVSDAVLSVPNACGVTVAADMLLGIAVAGIAVGVSRA